MQNNKEILRKIKCCISIKILTSIREVATAASLLFLKGVIMPFLLLFAFVPAILVIALAVMLIAGTINFLLNRRALTPENVARVSLDDIFDKTSRKIKECMKKQEEKKAKYVDIETVDIIVIKEE